ncbi:MAG: biotin/lipoate A/B protein ligase family protein [Desulfobacterales bacterium]|nr:biotin/lipoate A/B protein ligase family protein [Desulfobacterales bacterium]
MDVYLLGKQLWDDSQLVYHAMAKLGREGLILLSPASPYVCIGFHQDLFKEVDVDFCRRRRIPMFRRDVGGGAVYLDGNQLFFQMILKREDPRIPASKELFYRKFLQPVIHVYRRLGIAAEYKPINDVIAGNRKISGSGVGEIGPSIVFVGNLIVDFNHDMMARVLKVPDEKFRDKVYRTLKENLSTIRQELGDENAMQWNEDRLNEMMIEEFSKLLGPLNPRPLDDHVRLKMDELRDVMKSDAWLTEIRSRSSGRKLKIRDGVHLFQKVHKAKGGLMRADFEIHDGRFAGVSISGDFFCYPPDAVRILEAKLDGEQLSEFRSLIEAFYPTHSIETPGISIDDWAILFDAGQVV